MTLQEEKSALRRELLRKRGLLTGQEESDHAIFRAVTAMPRWRQAERVFLYLSVRGEPDTLALARAALAEGREVLAPVCTEREGEMEFFSFSDLAALRPGKWGIPEPDPALCRPAGEWESKTDICLVPGIAFDRRGYRLGYGKGYYDRFLAARKIHAVGLCREEFFLPQLPAGSHDRRVGFVATEAGVTVCAREGSR